MTATASELPATHSHSLGVFVEAGEEGGIVNAALDDPTTELHAHDDHSATLQTGLAGQFGGRQVNGHWRGLSSVVCGAPRVVPLPPDGLNLILAKCAQIG